MRPTFVRLFTRRRMRRWSIALVVVSATWLLVSFGIAHRLTRRSRPPFAEPVPEVSWAHFEAQRLMTADGQTLGAWYAEGADDAPSVLLLHGNGGSRRNSLERAEILAKGGGCTLLLISLRAHGDSSGRINDIGYSARHDVVSAVEFLRRRRPGKRVIVHGVSMGSAAAVFAAEELGDRVGGYVLESPYRDLKTALWHRTNAALPPILDRVAYAGVRIVAPLVLPEYERISPQKAIDRVPATVPILILAGGRDRLARPGEAWSLYRRARTHARLGIFPSAGHHDLIRSDPGRYRRTLVDFSLKSLAPSPRSSPPPARQAAHEALKPVRGGT